MNTSGGCAIILLQLFRLINIYRNIGKKNRCYPTICPPKHLFLIYYETVTNCHILENKNIKIARRGGNVAGDTRKSIEAETGKSVITAQKTLDFNKVIPNVIESVIFEKEDKNEQ